MANPLKILAALSASSGVAVSGSDGLKVQQGGLTVSSGTTAVQGLTATSISSSGGLQAGGTASLGSTLAVTGLVTAQSGLTVSGSTITSGSLTINGGGILTANNGVTVSGAALNASAVEVSASALSVGGGYGSTGVTVTSAGNVQANGTLTVDGVSTLTGDVTFGGNIVADVNENKSIFAAVTSNTITVGAAGATVSIPGTASVGGNLTVAGNLTVNGTTTTVNSQNLLVQDPIILVGSGSGGNSDGDRGFIFDLNSGNKAFYWDQSESKFTLAATTTNGTTNTIVPGTLQTLSVGQLFFSASAKDSVGGQIYDSGSNSVETVVSNIVDVVSGMMGSSLTANQIQSAYQGVRYAAYTTFLANNRAIISLSEVSSIGQNSISNGNFSGDRTCTGSAIYEMSGTTPTDLSNRLAQLSFDVTTRASGSLIWTNDLVSVQISAVQSGSYYYPQFTIDAPGLGDGQGNHLVRLIAVNENGQNFLIV